MLSSSKLHYNTYQTTDNKKPQYSPLLNRPNRRLPEDTVDHWTGCPW